jgi:hypothetical protein
MVTPSGSRFSTRTLTDCSLNGLNQFELDDALRRLAHINLLTLYLSRRFELPSVHAQSVKNQNSNHARDVLLGPPLPSDTHLRAGCPRVYPYLGLRGGFNEWTKVLAFRDKRGRFDPRKHEKCLQILSALWVLETSALAGLSYAPALGQIPAK